MTLEEFFVRWIGFLDAAFIYYVILLGRAAVISTVMLAVIAGLRKTILKNTVFLRGTVWSILLLAPFMGKMKCIYETKLGVRSLLWWQSVCCNHRWIPGLYVAGMLIAALMIFQKRRVLKREVQSLERMQFHEYEIAVNELAVSPFTTGLIHPVIVVPEVMLNSMSDEELEMILLHERIHIRLGHLWCFWLWDILRILLWANPLLHVCSRWFRADLEDICDRVTMQTGHQTAYAYGSLLLKSIQMLKGEKKGLEYFAAFAGERQYINMKQRMERVVAFKPYNRSRAFAFAIGCSGLFIVAFTSIIHISYPRYTNYNTVQIYNRTGNQILAADCEALREAIQIGDKAVYIDRKKLDRILKEQNVNEEMFLVYWGGFSKIPGVGGGGNGIFVDYTEQEGNLVVPYVDNDRDFITWLFKYL